MISDLVADRVVEGVFAVKTKRRLRTKGGAPYLALELVDPSGHIDARVWNDVELLDGRFAEGDAVRVLGRVEQFRDRLQLDVRTLEAADVDPSSLTPDDAPGRGRAAGLPRVPRRGDLASGPRGDGARRCSPIASSPPIPATLDDHHSYAGGLLEHTVGVATLCRETAQLHPRLRAELVLAAALVHDVGRTLELSRGPAFTPTEEGRLLGHVHLGMRLIEERADGPHRRAAGRAPALRRRRTTTCARRRTAEAAVLYHANQLDASAATRPTG